MVVVQGRAPIALLWGEERLTFDHFLSFMDYSATAYKELSCGANCNKGTIRPMTLAERKRDLCDLLCHEA
ncbi:unnamed protein product [Gulo gulo]|uniref:Uncharacterized protein n=1 Tax=Gulo gulo TaxID=48420 RepID=A0A9X9LWL9_GULGU|nr:unnamed protein product [Gulo gulo]